MNEINIADVISIVSSIMSGFKDSGRMLRDGADYFDTPYEIVIVYNVISVPYIEYQEEGFVHYLSGEFIDKNQYFISKKTTGQLNKYGWSNSLGIPFDVNENDDTLLLNQDDIMTQMGVIENV